MTAAAEQITVAGPVALRGTLRMPGDKSVSHRALIVADVCQRFHEAIERFEYGGAILLADIRPNTGRTRGNAGHIAKAAGR